MSAEQKPASPLERPLWMIAFLLLGIVFCLLFFVLQTLLQDQKNDSATPPQLPKRRLTSDEPSPRAARYEVPAIPATASERASVPEQSTPPLANPTAEAPVPSGLGTIAPASGGGYAPLKPVQTNYQTAIIGTVFFQGTPPPEQPLDLSQASYCGKLKAKPLSTRFFVVGTNGGLADTVVFIRHGLPSRLAYAVPRDVEMTFANCQIEPYVAAMTVDQHLLLKAQEPVNHVFRLTTERGRDVTAQVYAGKPTSVRVSTSFELLIPCRCQLHPWETAAVSVFPHPYFAVTGADGRFAITNVPPGKYVLEAVHQKAASTNSPTQELVLKAGQSVAANFAFEALDQPPGQ
jgi:hypothetical protein